MKYPMLLFTALSSATVLAAGVNPTAAEAQTPSPNEPIPAEAIETIEVRYARSFLELAQLDLQKALEANNKAPGSVPDSVLQTRRGVLALAESQLSAAIRRARADAALTHIGKCERSVRAEEAEWRRALEANRKVPGSVSKTEVKPLRLVAEVAHLGLIKASAADLDSAIEVLQWQIDELRSEVRSLRRRVEELAQDK
jgi:hypothetical protein